MPISEGAKLGRYEIGSKIGSGGMGEVYLAVDTMLDRKVAIKFLHEKYGKDSDKLNRFIREAKAASALNHPNILTIYEIGEADGQNYIATEFIEGSTLRDHLARKEVLQLSQILKIGVQVAEALAAAHAAGIVHRDIKPENIMIRKDGYSKVLDFGLAKLTEKNALDEISLEGETRAFVQTDPGTVMGTVSYMSPEQARGRDTDARTDIWSLGVVLYEIIAGKVPFTGETANHTIIAILEREPLVLQNVPDELQRIVRKSLSKDVDMRYQSARDLLIDLKTLRRDLDIQGELERSTVPNRETRSELSGENATALSFGGAASTQSGQIPLTQSVSSSSSSLEYAVTQAKTHKLIAAAAAVVLLALVGAGAYFGFLRPASRQINSIAVMPFVNGSGDPDGEYLSDGMAESLISSLSQIRNLNVKARSSVFRYKGKDTDPKTVGKELGVQAVLNGRVVQRGDQLTLTLELIDTSTENILWSEQYNRRQADLVALQTEIARDVSQKLKTRLSGTDEQKVTKSYTANPEAYQLYLKGMYHWNKRTAEHLRRSIDYFNQAIEKDPGYGLAYAGLALGWVLLPDYYAASAEECGPKGRAAAKRALELDGSLAEAQTALAYSYDLEFKFSEAMDGYRRAIELNPNFPTAHQWYGSCLMIAGRFDDAIAEMKRAQALDPLSLIINTNLADNYFFAGRYDEALAQAKIAIEMDPNFFLPHYSAGLAYEAKGQFAEALAEYKRLQALNDDPNYLASVSHLHAASGKRDEALKLLQQMKDIAPTRYVSHYSFAIAHIGLGDKEKALEELEKSYQDRGADFKYIGIDPFFKSMWGNPRFEELLKRSGLRT